MIVKILSSAASFKGVSYNTTKIDQNKGELMVVKNFGALQGLDRLGPEDYKGYLKMISAQNKNIKGPQFHVTISAKGQSHNKKELSEIAEKWLGTMGYAEQPYLIVFHKDTNNNHVHIVSTRIDKDGKKISSAFEKNRAIQNLNIVMGLDEVLMAQTAFEKALAYHFTTRPQFEMILESSGYIIGHKQGKVELVKFGKVVARFDEQLISDRMEVNKRADKIAHTIGSVSEKEKRKKQLHSVFHKYSQIYKTALVPKTVELAGGRQKDTKFLTSEFSDFLKMKFGIELVFHAKNDLPPYGYTIIDHAGKNVFKGSEIMSIKALLENAKDLGITAGKNKNTINTFQEHVNEVQQSAGHNTNSGGMRSEPHQETQSALSGVHEPFKNEEPKADHISSGSSPDQDNNSVTNNPDFSGFNDQVVQVNISDDIDDEAILGRNRRRQKKARTNTR